MSKGMPKALRAMMKKAPAPRAADSLGSLGRYELLELVGEGGHGKVYRAVERETSKVVAIKVLHEDIKGSELELRMKREGYAMGQLAGTCAAAIYECAQSDSGQLYLAMEFLEGQDLDALIDSHERQGRRLPIPTMLELLGPVIETLEAAHARGIIHRDLKPENIFVRRQGDVRLVDFGLVKDLNLEQMTAAGIVAGSPSYIAPEAWAGEPDRLDHRIDVYAMGVLAFRILTGAKPFVQKGTMLDFILEVTTAPRPSLRALRPELPAEIDSWTKRALAIKPEDRFQSVSNLWEALRPIVATTAS